MSTAKGLKYVTVVLSILVSKVTFTQRLPVPADRSQKIIIRNKDFKAKEDIDAPPVYSSPQQLSEIDKKKVIAASLLQSIYKEALSRSFSANRIKDELSKEPPQTSVSNLELIIKRRKQLLAEIIASTQ